MAKELEAKGFRQTTGNSKGMYGTFLWESERIQFWLGYDRGYYDCGLSSAGGPSQKSFLLVSLLGFIHKDRAFYEEETALAGHFGLSASGNVWLFLHYLDKIEVFFEAGGAKRYEEYDRWVRGEN